MLQNNTVKSNNDIEKAYESIINSAEFNYCAQNKMNPRINMQTKIKTLETESFDNFPDKRNRKS